jgi:hypothetical protein
MEAVAEGSSSVDDGASLASASGDAAALLAAALSSVLHAHADPLHARLDEIGCVCRAASPSVICALMGCCSETQQALRAGLEHHRSVLMKLSEMKRAETTVRAVEEDAEDAEDAEDEEEEEEEERALTGVWHRRWPSCPCISAKCSR